MCSFKDIETDNATRHFVASLGFDQLFPVTSSYELLTNNKLDTSLTLIEE